jgi:hypothetical protein
MAYEFHWLPDLQIYRIHQRFETQIILLIICLNVPIWIIWMVFEMAISAKATVGCNGAYFFPYSLYDLL